MVNWKQRELEQVRNAAMEKGQQVRELKTQTEPEHGTHHTHAGLPLRGAKWWKHGH